MTIRESLESVLYQALKAAVEAGELPLNEIPQPSLERPREEGHGDWACTIAMRLAKAAHMNPRAIAQAIVDHLPENNLVESFEIAGPGFINLTLTNASFQAVVSEARQQGSDFGKSELSEPCKVNLEYVSANPTGPMHVGHGRWAALGDAIARVMRHAGYSVDEEFYINDQGNQMNVFGNSIVVRYQQLLGQDVDMPEACYGGAYIKDIAQAIIDADGDKWLDANEDERLVNFRERGYAMMLDSVKNTLSTFGNNFDTWFSERSLFVANENGETKQQRAFDVMNEKGLLFEAEGATFFRSTDYGDDKDRVLVKANGDLTYFMSDVAYHYDKMQRGYDHLIDIWGADHHGYIKRCKAMMAACVDATRYLMLSKSADQAIDFDIEVAKKQDSSNPVYYVQYAHARICSILRKAGEARGMNVESAGIEEIVAELGLDDIDLAPLAHESELALMRKMADFSDLVAGAARDRAPFRLTHYAQELAGLFHSFYGNCHVLGEEECVEKARLALVDSTRIVLALSLDLLGVSAPERM